MIDLPKLAISVRQPWTTGIVYLGKRIENRSWRRPNPGLNFRGPVCLHAAKGMTRYEYEDAAEFMSRFGVTCPLPDTLPRGGIIGVARIVDVIRACDDPWFMGPVGLVLDDVEPVDFIPADGQLGFFEWSKSDGGPDEPAKWMTRWGRETAADAAIDRELF